MTKRTLIATCATAAMAAVAGGCASQSSLTSSERPDCPGKIVCPLTGELVCADRCPLQLAGSADVALAAKQPSCCTTAN